MRWTRSGVGDKRSRIGGGKSARVGSEREATLAILQQGEQKIRQLRIDALFRDQDGRVRAGKNLRVERLVILGSKRKRHQDRRHAKM